jgi:hypothetical protein
MRILITDMTEMHQSNYCVAGWCFQSQLMVRLLPGIGANWTTGMLSQYRFSPGATIEFEVTGQPNTDFPHRTEDRVINLSTIRQISAGPAIWSGGGSPASVPTLGEAFEGHIRCNGSRNGYFHGVYVPFQTQTRSLYAVSIIRRNLTFFEDNNKLRAYLDDYSRTTWRSRAGF